MGFKNEPDPKGEQYNPFSAPAVFDPNKPLAAGLTFNSKTKKFVIAHDEEEDEEKRKDGIDSLGDTFVSEKEFKQIPSASRRRHIVVDVSDDECSLPIDEVEDACKQLCIDR